MNESKKLVISTCMLAGKIMLENGSEVYRVEDTMKYIATKSGFPNSINYVTVTGIMFALDEGESVKLRDIQERNINLSKVVEVNNLSRQYCSSQMTLENLYSDLEIFSQNNGSYNITLKIICAGIVSTTLMFIYSGIWSDILITFIIGSSGYAVSYFGRKWFKVLYLDMFIAALIIGILASISVDFSLASNRDSVIVGSVMPLVPGIAITNSFRDIVAGDLLSGTARGAESLFTAAAIGMGIVSGLLIMRGL